MILSFCEKDGWCHMDGTITDLYICDSCGTVACDIQAGTGTQT